MSRTPFIPRATPLFTAWIRRNHRLLSSSSASSALHETYSSPSSPANDVIHLTDSAVMVLSTVYFQFIIS
uniref:Iron-sulfur assembly protein IscA-like 2 n=1 Tax=Rhizophora mucronata TaxID=61149 RepID=A0A2P2IY78_RHIMU